MKPLESISRANDTLLGVVGLASTKKEFIGKQLINSVLLFIILLVFGCLDFAKLSFHFENLLNVSYWMTVLSKTIAGVCAFNIGINIMWETELKKDKILEQTIKLYEHLNKNKSDDFEYFIENIFNPAEKIKAYISYINRKIFRLNSVSRARDRLLYYSVLPERQAEKDKNRYCIKRKELEELKTDEYISKNISSINVKYNLVDPTVFELEIDGSAIVSGVKTKGNINAGKIKSSTNVVMGMVLFSMFITAIGLELNQEEFANQMVEFWHYLLKCATDIGIVLWQTYRGMLNSRKIISNELTQPFVGRNKVLKEYYKWQYEQERIDLEKYTSIIKFQEEIEVEMRL